MSLSLAIVMPAYNEEARLPASIETLLEYLAEKGWDWELRIVDDGSSDQTLAIASAAAQREPRVVAQAEPHRGKGGAVKAGMLASDKEFRFICDADLSMPVHELERFLPPQLEGFDLAIGSREGEGARRVGEPWMRHLMGRVFNRVVRLAVRDIDDTQCGFKMFRAEAAEAIFPVLTIDGWAFDVEMLHIAQRRGMVIHEVPIEWHYMERSQISPLSDSLRMFREVLIIRRNGLRGLYDPLRIGG
jgi:dolichyl-phosphate beta-glucosyltransferase